MAFKVGLKVGLKVGPKVGQKAGLVLLACFLAVGVAEDVVDWRYLGTQALPLLLATMLGVGATRQRQG